MYLFISTIINYFPQQFRICANRCVFLIAQVRKLFHLGIEAFPKYKQTFRIFRYLSIYLVIKFNMVQPVTSRTTIRTEIRYFYSIRPPLSAGVQLVILHLEKGEIKNINTWGTKRVSATDICQGALLFLVKKNLAK